MQLELRASRVLFQLLVIVHLLSITLLWLIHAELLLKTALFGVILLSALHTRRQIRYRPQLTLTSGQEIILHQHNDELIGTLSADTVVTPFLVLLRFRLADQRSTTTIPIFYDALPHEQFRALRVHLKLNTYAIPHLRG